MPRTLKLPFAVCGDKIIHISEVESGRQINCLCPVCNTRLIARKGNLRQHHFAHDTGTNCNGESALHWFGKHLLLEAIDRALTEGCTIPMEWQCDQCDHKHDGNLLKKAASVALEQVLGEARPDLLLKDATGKPVVAIEVIVTHEPEQSARDFYLKQNIVVVEVRIKDGIALEALKDLRELKADAVSFCTRKKCPDCHAPLRPKMLNIVVGDCYRCHLPMKVAFIEADGMGFPSSAFSPQEIECAKKQGCILEVRYSKTVNNRYLANVCPKCKAFIGEHYMHNYSCRDDSIEPIQTGWYCSDCNNHFPMKG
ncbi:MAG: hypothetical protein HY043_16705 [Verrucomicrobia bacterium]|nr:hypothetical protein [Verrucomicrobiota bacterium]